MEILVSVFLRKGVLGFLFNIIIGGIMGSYVFFDMEVLVYEIGFGFVLVLVLIGVFVVFCVEVVYKWGNMKKVKMIEEEVYVMYI